MKHKLLKEESAGSRLWSVIIKEPNLIPHMQEIRGAKNFSDEKAHHVL